MCAMSIILVAFASVKVAFYSVTLALFSRASGLIWTKYTIRRWQKLRRDLEVRYLAPDSGFMLWHKLPKDLQIKYSGQLRKTGINQ